jgi:uncharacterized protein YjiS (DUF1127 family)
MSQAEFDKVRIHQIFSTVVATTIVNGCAQCVRITRANTAVWLRRGSTRRKLGELDARDLADIGRSERERQVECSKWFWQV